MQICKYAKGILKYPYSTVYKRSIFNIYMYIWFGMLECGFVCPKKNTKTAKTIKPLHL